jgi:hypothetical protein
MNMLKRVGAARFGLVATAIAVLSSAAFAADGDAVKKDGRIQMGVLNCEVEGGVGLIVGSSKKMSCTFKRGQGDHMVKETYLGSISKFGLDVGVTGTQFMKWAVFGPEDADSTEGFNGKYVGVSADGSLGIGFGANALVGGSEKSFVLQPVSIQGQTGLNLAVGVSSMKIEKVSETPKS